jgi:hypothetical protein
VREIDATSYRGLVEQYFVFKRLMAGSARSERGLSGIEKCRKCRLQLTPEAGSFSRAVRFWLRYCRTT